jgi:hypothetical protein
LDKKKKYIYIYIYITFHAYLIYMISKMLFLIHLNLFGLKKLLLMFDLVTNIVVTFDLLPQFDVSSKKN